MDRPFAPRSLFLGHGAPTLATSDAPAARFLDELGARLPKPRAVLVVSPHWTARGFAVKCAPRFEAWHDFGGFPPDLYALRYTPAGDAALAVRTEQVIREAGLPVVRSEDTRIDHGVWVPLLRLWPQADVPVVQIAVSLQSGQAGAAAHWALGAALKPLTGDGILLIGSGSLTHNLRDLDFADEQAAPFAWAKTFDDWMARHLLAQDRDTLIDYRRLAPRAARAHPTEEHLLPLFVAAAAGGTQAQRLHDSFTHGSLSMAAYAFA